MPTRQLKIFKCGKLFLPEPETARTCILVRDGRVADLLTPRQVLSLTDAEVVNLTHKVVGPGLVDIHCHGAMNSDFADGTEEDIRRAATGHLARGTTTILAGVGSCTIQEMLRACDTVRRLKHSTPNLAGVHLEGPYFNSEQYGCHLRSMIRNPDPQEWKQLEPYKDVFRLCTIAPELPGALEYIRHFSRSGTVFSIGHSMATYDEICRAVDAGLRHSTHIFCAMPTAQRVNLVLEPGVLESVLMIDALTTEIIGDGIHVGPRLVEFVCKIKGILKTAFISDALRGVGCGPGNYAFGPRNGQICRIVTEPAVGVVPDRPGILASSAIVLSDSLRIFSERTALGLADLWRMASATPAAILGLSGQKGSLSPGCDADILALDAHLNVANVFVAGNSVSNFLN